MVEQGERGGEVIRLEEDEVEDLIRYHFDQKVPWAQLAEDEGCDAAALERGIQRWEGGPLVLPVAGSSALDPDAEEGVASWAGQIPSNLSIMAQQGGVSMREAARLIREQREAERAERGAMAGLSGAQLRDLALGCLGGIDIHDKSVPTPVRREALVKACSALLAHDVEVKAAALILGFSGRGRPPLLMSAWQEAAHEHGKKRKRADLLLDVLLLLELAGGALCGPCLGGGLMATQVVVNQAIAGLRLQGCIAPRPACSQCVRTQAVHGVAAWERTGKPPRQS